MRGIVLYIYEDICKEMMLIAGIFILLSVNLFF